MTDKKHNNGSKTASQLVERFAQYVERSSTARLIRRIPSNHIDSKISSPNFSTNHISSNQNTSFRLLDSLRFVARRDAVRGLIACNKTLLGGLVLGNSAVQDNDLMVQRLRNTMREIEQIIGDISALQFVLKLTSREFQDFCHQYAAENSSVCGLSSQLVHELLLIYRAAAATLSSAVPADELHSAATKPVHEHCQ